MSIYICFITTKTILYERLKSTFFDENEGFYSLFNKPQKDKTTDNQ